LLQHQNPYPSDDLTLDWLTTVSALTFRDMTTLFVVFTLRHGKACQSLTLQLVYTLVKTKLVAVCNAVHGY